MRILGEVQHPSFKITILEMSSKVSIQIEDGLLVQTYRFRDGASVNSLYAAQEYCTPEFLKGVQNTFETMRNNVNPQSQSDTDSFDFPNII